jgi:hypothetical chaperone protein
MDRDGVTVDEEISRPDFEDMIREHVDTIVDTARETVASAGLAPGDVDVCFLTGGCSLVPVLGARFQELFPGRLSTEGDAFTSVAAGLALYGLEGQA